MKKIIVIVGALLVTAVAVYATTATNTVGGSTKLAEKDSQKIFVVKNTLTLGAVNYAASNTISLINIPANCAVLGIDVKTSVPCTNATVTADFGDNSTPAQFIAGFDAVTTTNVNSISAASTWKVYDAANSINILFDHIPGNTGTFIVTAIMADLN